MGVVLACAGADAVEGAVLAPAELVLEGGGVWDWGVAWVACDGGACEDGALCEVRTEAPTSSTDPAKQIAVIFPKESVIAISPEKVCKIRRLRR